MCAIFGIIQQSRSDELFGKLKEMSDVLSHRGPDAEGFFTDRELGLGHRRLSIIDPEGGHQPIFSESEDVVLTFNGEIYNHLALRRELEELGHSFRTGSDAEVIVHGYEEWGESIVARLDGMFAFALADLRLRRLWLVRDRLGIKPVVYLSTEKLFAFASEIEALNILPEQPNQIDRTSIGEFLRYGVIPAPHTAYRYIYKLPPGHWMWIELRDLKSSPPKCYWQPTLQPNLEPDEDQWTRMLEAELIRAVKTHLMSDVPVGAFLSGGIDSTTVVSLMASQSSKPINTFAIGFEDGDFNELPFAKLVADRYGTEHHTEVVRPNALSVLPEIVSHHGEPFADPSALPTHYLAKMTAKHVKVALSGDGGDELFRGYPWYAAIENAFSGWKGVVRRMSYPLLGRKASPRDTCADARAILSTDTIRQLMPGVNALGRESTTDKHTMDAVAEVQRQDLLNYLPNDLLAKIDIATMAFGLEARVPLLDHHFVDFCLTIPPPIIRGKGGGNGLKSLLKERLRREFGTTFVDRPKQGFSVPLETWLDRKGSGADVHERIAGEPMMRIFNTKELNLLLSEQSLRPHQKWALLVLSEWLHQHPNASC